MCASLAAAAHAQRQPPAGRERMVLRALERLRSGLLDHPRLRRQQRTSLASLYWTGADDVALPDQAEVARYRGLRAGHDAEALDYLDEFYGTRDDLEGPGPSRLGWRQRARFSRQRLLRQVHGGRRRRRWRRDQERARRPSVRQDARRPRPGRRRAAGSGLFRRERQRHSRSGGLVDGRSRRDAGRRAAGPLPRPQDPAGRAGRSLRPGAGAGGRRRRAAGVPPAVRDHAGAADAAHDRRRAHGAAERSPGRRGRRQHQRADAPAEPVAGHL